MKQERVYTQEELMRKLRFLRSGQAFLPEFLKGGQRRDGRELFLDTAAGRVRVLGYQLEDPRVLPLYVNLHGSGFVFGNAEMDDPFLLQVARKAEVKILSVDYSLAPEHPFPAAIEECYAVVEYAKTHPAEFGIDPERIAVGGQSAGGNFAAAVQLLDGERGKLGLNCLVLDYPPLDVYTDAADKPRGTLPVFASRMFDACYCTDRAARKNPLISPLFAAPEQLAAFPPTLIITASKDSLCREGEAFRDRLREAGVSVRHRRFDAGHGFNLRPGKESDASWRLITQFLRELL